MIVTTETMVVAIVVAILWVVWALFSETRHNHGLLVAFLMPLTPILIPLLLIVYVVVKYASYLVFLLLGRRSEHDEFMRKFKIRSGVFLLF